MTCVTECPDTAILGKAVPAAHLEASLGAVTDPAERDFLRTHWARTRKYFEVPERKGLEGAMFGILIDPTKRSSTSGARARAWGAARRRRSG
jgi:hypothetical protein